MKIFVDSANLQEIEESLKRGFVSGVTTNPSLLSKEERRDFEAHVHDIISLIEPSWTSTFHPSLSVEVLTTDPVQMFEQAQRFLRIFDYTNLAIKIPIGWDELQVIHKIKQIGGQVNCTAVMSYSQAIMAADAGASYVSIFWGRIRDSGGSPARVVSDVHQAFVDNRISSEIIVGSIRSATDVSDAFLAGADIVTIPYKFLAELCQHPETTKVVNQFMRDFAGWST